MKDLIILTSNACQQERHRAMFLTEDRMEYSRREIQLQKPYQTIASEKYARHITDICNPLIWRHAGSPAIDN